MKEIIIMIALLTLLFTVTLNAENSFYKSPSSGQTIQISASKTATWSTDMIKSFKAKLDQLGFIPVPATQTPDKEICFGVNPGSLKGKTVTFIINMPGGSQTMYPIYPKMFEPGSIAMALR